MFGAEAAETLECVMFDAPEFNQKLFGAVETQIGYRIPDTADSKFYIRSEKRPRAVLSLPDEKELPFTYKDGKILFEYPRISIWMMVAVQYESEE